MNLFFTDWAFACGRNKWDNTPWKDEDAYSRPRGRGGVVSRGVPSERVCVLERSHDSRPPTQRQEMPKKDVNRGGAIGFLGPPSDEASPRGRGAKIVPGRREVYNPNSVPRSFFFK